ncbi:MAG: hypothetical protein ACI86H_002857 [bacterium]|jgi:hypothetical protein
MTLIDPGSYSSRAYDAKLWRQYLTHREYTTVLKFDRDITRSKWKQLLKTTKKPIKWFENGFSYKQIIQWNKYFNNSISISEAGQWLKNKFNPSQTKIWINAGFSASEANLWRKNKFSISQAKIWKDVGFSASEAGLWRKNKFSISQAKIWINAGFSVSETGQWLKNKFSISQSKAWKKAGFFVFYSELKKIKFSISQTKIWKQSGFLAFDAKQWKKHKFSPSQAQVWRDAGFSIFDAKLWKGDKFSVSQAKPWKDAGFSIFDAIPWKKTVFSLKESIKLASAHIRISTAEIIKHYAGSKQRKDINYFILGNAVLNANLSLSELDKYYNSKISLSSKLKYLKEYKMPYWNLLKIKQQCGNLSLLENLKDDPYDSPKCYKVSMKLFQRLSRYTALYRIYKYGLQYRKWKFHPTFLMHVRGNKTLIVGKTVAIIKTNSEFKYTTTGNSVKIVRDVNVLWQKESNFNTSY